MCKRRASVKRRLRKGDSAVVPIVSRANTRATEDGWEKKKDSRNAAAREGGFFFLRGFRVKKEKNVREETSRVAHAPACLFFVRRGVCSLVLAMVSELQSER